MTVLFNIFGLVSDAWFVTVALFVFVGAGLYFYDALGAKDRGAIATWLRAPGSGGLYTSLVGGVLDRVDRALTPESVEQVPDPAPGKPWWRKLRWLTKPRAPTSIAAETSARAAFGWPVFDAALRFALVYPVVLLVVSWAATGDNASIGQLELLPQGVPTWQRGAAIFVVALVSLYRPLMLSLASQAKRIAEMVVGSLTIAFAATLATRYALWMPGGPALPATATDTATVIVAVVGICAGVLGAVRALALAVTVAVVTTFVIVLFVEGRISPISLITSISAFVFIFIGLGVIAVKIMVATCVRNRRAMLGYVGLVVSQILCLTIFSYLIGVFHDIWRTALVFIVLLPMFNAWFDFVSIGMTRWLVRTGTHRRRWALALALGDVAAAAVFFTALGCTLIAAVHGLNQLEVRDFLNLQSLFDGIRSAPGQYWWLYATIFTTLVPTFLHVAVAGASAIAWLPQAAKRRLLRHVEGASEWAGHRWIATLALAAIATVAILVPLFVAAGGAMLLYQFHPEIGGGYLRVFEGFAHWIGATVEPGPLIIAT